VSIVVADDPPTLKVIDHGPGVRADQRNAIFRRFWQGGRDQKGGAGLGLDIAARTVVAHGGAISVGEAPEGGAVFTMEFQTISEGMSEVNLPFREPHPASQPLQRL
jgi:signal transduction histidine kinase